MRTVRPSFIAAKSGMMALFLLLSFAGSSFSQPVRYPSPIAVATPALRIVAPANHAVFYAPVDVPIFVYAQSLGVTSEFEDLSIFAGTNFLGSPVRLNSRVFYPTGVGAPPGIYSGPSPFDLPEYSLVWSNPPVGTYVLTVVGRRGSLIPPPAPIIPVLPLNVTSAPVTITILSPVPTATNHLDIVSVIATDPVAVAGTNCWVSLGTTNATPAWTNWPPLQWDLITNCGPKSATFTVRRFGDATSALTVNYALSGTASNMVDYAILTNLVVIPAGQASAQVTVVPVDNAQSNIFGKTVVITLTASPNKPPLYALGFPSRAEAVIFENLPRAVLAVLPDQTFHVNAVGPDGAWFRVEYSSDLVNWTTVCTNQVVQGSIDFVDPDAVNSNSRFYRALPQ